MHSSQYRKLPRHYNPQEIFLFQLTQQQARTLQYYLPKGCSLSIQSKPKQNMINKQSESQIIQNQNSSLKQTNLTKKQIPVSKGSQKSIQKKTSKDQIPQNVKPCFQILQQLKSYKNSWPFLEPVDAQALGIPEYYQIIKQPIDLSMIQKKYKGFSYKTPQQFYRDINLMIKNSLLFNQANEQFIKLTNDFEKYFFRIAGPEAKPVVDKKLQREKQKQRQRLQRQKAKQEKIKEKMLQKEKQKQKKLQMQQQQQAQMALKMAKKKKKMIPKDLLQAQNISVEQKQELANNIHNLGKEHLKGIRQIVFESRSEQSQDGCHQNEFDIQKIGYKKIRELQKYVRVKLQEIEASKFSLQNAQKKEEVDLDELESEWTSEFVL